MRQFSSLKLSVAELNGFRVAARECSITRAARLLHTSQSSLSRRIRLLEDKLQVCLLMRSGNGIELTEIGRKLLRHIDSLCLHEEEMIAELRGLHPHGLHGLMRIAAGSALIPRIIVPAIAPLLHANPGILVEFVSGEGSRLECMLVEGRADLIVSGNPVSRRGFVSTRLGSEVRYVVESSVIRRRDEVWLELAHGEEASERYATALPVSHRRCVVGDTQTLISCVEAGLGRALLAPYLLEPGAPLRRVPDVVPCVCERFLHHAKEFRNSRLLQGLVNALLSTAPGLLANDPARMLVT